MKFTRINLVALLIIGCLAVVNTEEEAPKKSGLLQRRNIGGRPGGLQKSASTTTTTPATAEYDEEDYVEEGEKEEKSPQQESVTTTPEPPKKSITLAVRPFRSNDDLLNTLKKRREQSKLQPKTVTEKPHSHAYEQDDTVEDREVAKPRPKSTKAVAPTPKKRQFGSVKSTNAKAPLQDNQAQVIDDAAPSASAPLSERVGRTRFALNKNGRS